MKATLASPVSGLPNSTGRPGLLLVALACVALPGAPSVALSQVQADLGAIVEWQDTLTLEENDEVINVLYNVVLDPAGGYLVADDSEGQFRRYDRDGGLLWSFGRKGDGPNEFRSPSTLVRLSPSGPRLALLDRQGKIAIYDEDGDSLVSTVRVELSRVSDAIIARDGLIWVSSAVGIRGDPNALTYFHLIDPYTGREISDMFGPSISDDYRKEILYINWAGIGVDPSGDQIWGVIAARDTLYSLDPTTRTIVRRTQLRSPLVRPLTQMSGEDWNDLIKRRRWAERQSFLTDVFPLQDGRVVVQFQEFRNALPIWGLLIVDEEGVVEFAAMDTHRLLTVDPTEGLLVFQDSAALEGNRWLIGKLRK